MIVNVEASTVTIGGVTFPACVLVCPPHEAVYRDDADRMLGGLEGPGITNTICMFVYVPCENGALVEVVHDVGEDTYDVTVRCLDCAESKFNGDAVWLPRTLSIIGNDLWYDTWPRPAHPHHWFWRDAEPDWIAEFIPRVSRMSFERLPHYQQAIMLPLAAANWEQRVHRGA